ncbi:hypothetical protein PVAND_006474 [Polypedilum vanderplanki]|uniref:F-box domain-containing protein n=1 Tax=Polypedilum vanderplanki TaxID=319348 RepID=A0A9J6C465_POLVA|nr:hypothetical protein PVAND_006474 [Polypedilum vanderplanki]
MHYKLEILGFIKRMIDIRNLPPELIEQIFIHLTNPKDILSVSETCKKFNYIVNNCENITKKLTLYLKHPTQFNEFIAAIKNTKRRYRNLVITRTRERSKEYVINRIPEAFSRISSNVRFLKLKWHPHRSIEVSIIDMNRMNRPRREALLQYFHNRQDWFNQHLAQPLLQPPLQRLLPNIIIEEEDDPVDLNIIQQIHNLNNNNNNIMENNFQNIQEQQLQNADEIRDELHQEFIGIIKQFKNLERMEWSHVHLEKRTMSNTIESLDYTRLKELKLKFCDSFCFELLTSCQNSLTTLQICEPFLGNLQNPGIESFETFLVGQKSLKDLKIFNIQYPRLFQNDSTAEIQFKLNHLVLHNVFFKNKTIAENFFRTQNELISIDFQIKNEKLRNLDEMLWYNNIIRILFSQNSMLRIINLEKSKYKIDNCDFLTSVKNTSVQELKFNVTAEDRNAEFFKQLIRIFPNLKAIQYKSEESDIDSEGDVCFENGTILDKVENLSIINCSVNSLINLNAMNLISFEYSPKLNGKFIDDYIGGFFHKHRGIKHLVIGNETSRSYFFVSYKLCENIVDFLTQLESVTIYNFAEVNKSVKKLCTLRNLKTLTLSALQYQQFTAKTKVECERMKLKLIPVKVGFSHETVGELSSSSPAALEYGGL